MTDINQVITRLADVDPQLSALLDEHLDDNEGELLRTVFLADVARWAANPASNVDSIKEVCARLEEAYEAGDNADQDIIGTGFVESLPAIDEPGGAVLGLLPRALLQVAQEMNLTEPWHAGE